MADVPISYELSPQSFALQEEIKATFPEVAPSLGSLVFNRTLGDRVTHWRERGSILAVDAPIGSETLEPNTLFADHVIEATSFVTEVPVDVILGRGRNYEAVQARQIAMYVARQYVEMSYPSIAMSFYRDHSTVMHAVGKIEELLAFETTMVAHKRKTTIRIKQVESLLKDLLHPGDRGRSVQEMFDAVAVTRDGLYSYPASKIKLFYAKILGLTDPDTLVLNRRERSASDELLQTYGAYALDVLATVKS